jgi:ferric-dicitrate binding protein FerR (iron transport regulator)
MNDSRLTYLFQAYFNRTASSGERDELMVLLERAENDEQVKVLLAQAWEQTNLTNKVFDDNQGEEMLANIIQAEKADKPVPVVPLYRKFFNWTRVAAAAAILIAAFTGIYFLFNQKPKQDIAQSRSTNQKEIIVPGGDKAILTLADGSAIVLDTLHTGSLPQQGSTRIVKLNTGSLAYNAGAGSQHETLFNTLSTPSGGQFQLVLPDGTRVWLNSSSSIRFPTAFNGEDRKVELTGEAYFEVAKNAAKPFKVSVKEMEVEVLGTHFNIMAYDDERSINTTLLEGSVKVSKGSAGKILVPGQQSKVGSSGDIKVTEADVEEAIAWKNGFFQFNSYDIETVMRQVARWYDVQVVYKDKIPGGNFSGIVSRKNNISRVLEILQGGDVQFKIEGKKVLVF